MAAATAIMTGITLVSSIAGTVKSFKTAKEMKGKMEDAEARAEEALAEAKEGLDLNFFEEMAIQKTPYDIERENVLSQGAGVLEAGKEAGVRGVAGTAGRVLAAQQEAQADITDRQVDEMTKLDTLIASEDARLRDLKTQISLKESEGASKAVADYEKLANQATQQGWQGVTDTLATGLQMVPLFGKDAAGELRAFQSMDGEMPGGRIGDPNAYTLSGDYGFDMGLGPSSYKDFFGNMSLRDYKSWKGSLSRDDYSNLFQTDAFRKSYDVNKTTYDFMNPFLQTMNLKYGSKENKGQL